MRKLAILHEGNEIGFVDDNLIFHYEKAPDVKTALGWGLASDGGANNSLVDVNLDTLARKLETAIHQGTGEEIFTGVWGDAIREAFQYRTTSRYSSGYCLHRAPLWKVATRTVLGEEHPGYELRH